MGCGSSTYNEPPTIDPAPRYNEQKNDRYNSNGEQNRHHSNSDQDRIQSYDDGDQGQLKEDEKDEEVEETRDDDQRGEGLVENEEKGAQNDDPSTIADQLKEEEKDKDVDETRDDDQQREGLAENEENDEQVEAVEAQDDFTEHIDNDDPSTVSDDDWLNKRRNRDRSGEDDEEDDDDDDADDKVTSLKHVEKIEMMGRVTSLMDTRVDKISESMAPPDVEEGEIFTDSAFLLDVALEETDEVLWKRPSEFCEEPLLFTDGTTRFDIEQGGAGTCWFLSILAALADKPEVIKQIMPDDAYAAPGTDGYTGVFHCRFWRFGEWVDIYCDDFLPVRSHGDSWIPWGARSSDPCEMWVSLMEKAFARFQGSYNKVYGGWSGDAFIALTGGVAETLSKKKTDNFTPKVLYKRVQNGLTSGAVITCSCPEDKDGEHGLAGGHAYTVTGASKIKFRNKPTSMIRVRNPWGTGKGEWTGPFSDGAPEWNEVDDSAKHTLKIQGREDGEFWMTLKDYVTYFPDTHVCNFTPDFDKDGREDGLNQLTCVLGEWKGETAAGCDVERKMNNQKYIFTVPDLASEMTPVVLQIIQRKEGIRSKEPNYYLRLDLYKIDLEEKKDGKEHYVLDEMTNYTNYYGGESYLYRYNLSPGDYFILPTTMEPGHERQFCIRIFSDCSIPCREVSCRPMTYIRQAEPTFSQGGSTYNMSKMVTELGGWVCGQSAGGQISNKTFHINPQYTFSVTGSGKQPLMVDILQETSGPKVAIGYKIFPLIPGKELPYDLRTLYSIHTNGLKNIEGGSPFVLGYEAEGYFLVPPGDYLLITFTQNPDEEKSYALVTASKSDLRLRLVCKNELLVASSSVCQGF